MKSVTAIILALLMAASLVAATSNEVESWKREFPTVSVEKTFELRLMVSQYEIMVSQANAGNIYSITRKLRERAEKDLSDLKLQGGKGPSSREAREKRDWILTQLLPYVRKIG